MTKVVVLGCGLVGRHVAEDLAASFEVTAADVRQERLDALHSNVRPMSADLSDLASIRHLVSDFDIVVDALPGRIGLTALAATIEAGRDIVDIAFMPGDALELDERAQAKGVRAIVDMGVAPGMSNALLGHTTTTFQSVKRFECLVGGLPVERAWPFEYKAPFSPADVIEEYVRPARFMKRGELVVKPALSDPERVEIDGVGTLEAFNTDGLRSLLRTMTVPDMTEKTLRYPGHRALMEVWREAGFFAEAPIRVGGQRVRPLDVTSALLFEQWALGPDDAEFTAMRVTVEGVTRGGGWETVRWDLLDRGRDGVPSMARTTGLPCAAAVHLLANGGWSKTGVSAPEHVGMDAGAFDFLMAYQAERGVTYRRTVTASD